MKSMQTKMNERKKRDQTVPRHFNYRFHCFISHCFIKIIASILPMNTDVKQYDCREEIGNGYIGYSTYVSNNMNSNYLLFFFNSTKKKN